MDIKLKELRELICEGRMDSGAQQVFLHPQGDTEPLEDHGYCIAVLDKGFVYVGDVKTDSKYIYITSAHNVRKWTGGHGLSWYAINGFDDDITLDASGDVKAPAIENKHLIKCTVRA